MQVERGHQRCQTSILSDYCDGAYYKSHRLFFAHENALQVMLYYDDVEVCNPLGSHTKKHKLGKYAILYTWLCHRCSILTHVYTTYIGLFYFLLGNIPPKYRSKLNAIQLVAVCKQRYIKEYSMFAVLHPIIQDLKQLVNTPNVLHCLHLTSCFFEYIGGWIYVQGEWYF